MIGDKFLKPGDKSTPNSSNMAISISEPVLKKGLGDKYLTKTKP